MELNKANMKKIAFLIAFAVIFYTAVKNIYLLPQFVNFVGAVLSPVLLGLVFAFIINVLMRLVETRLFAGLNRRCTKIWPKIRRPISFLVALLIILGVIALILLIVVPELVRTITSLTNQIPTFFNGLQVYLARIETAYPDIGNYLSNIKIDWANVSEMIALYGKNLASTLVNSTVTATTNVFHGFITFVLGFVISVNILMQKEKLKRQVKKVMVAYVPLRYNHVIFRLCRLTYRAFSNFIIGQCTESCILGTLCFIGMSIFRFPYALLISVFVVFMSLIPIIGSFLSTVVGALIISIVSPIQALWYIVFFVVLQQLEGNLIYPHVVGSRVGLPALWVLVAVTIGGNLFGLVGMLVNIPLCSVLYVLLRENVEKRLRKKQKTEERSPES